MKLVRNFQSTWALTAPVRGKIATALRANARYMSRRWRDRNIAYPHSGVCSARPAVRSAWVPGGSNDGLSEYNPDYPLGERMQLGTETCARDPVFFAGRGQR